jgi:hypothetical protein
VYRYTTEGSGLRCSGTVGNLLAAAALYFLNRLPVPKLDIRGVNTLRILYPKHTTILESSGTCP